MALPEIFRDVARTDRADGLMQSSKIASRCQPVSETLARKMAEEFLAKERQRNARWPAHLPPPVQGMEAYALASVRPLENDAGLVWAYLHRLHPAGYIITSANTGIQPILGFSFHPATPADSAPDPVRLRALCAEVEARLRLVTQPLDPQQRGEYHSNLQLWSALGENGQPSA